MRKRLSRLMMAAVLMLVLSPDWLRAQSCQFAWDHVLPESLTAFRLYMATREEGPYTRMRTIAAKSGQPPALTVRQACPSPSWWYVTAVNAEGESAPSNVYAKAAPSPATGLGERQ